MGNIFIRALHLSCLLLAFLQLWVMWHDWKGQDHADAAIGDVLIEIMKKTLNLQDDIFMK